MRAILLSILCLTFASCGDKCGPKKSNASMAFYSHLSTHNLTHKLYDLEDKDAAPHPFYKDRAGDPMFSVEDACGSGTYLFDPETDELEFAISYSQLSGTPVMMHFHLGGAHMGGPIIQTIFGEPYTTVKGLGSSPEEPLSCKNAPEGRAGFVRGVYKLKGNLDLKPPLTVEMEREALMNGKIYVNLHTYLNENGEIRGQVLPCLP